MAKKKLYTFQSPEQLMSKDPWGSLMNAGPSQAAITQASPMAMGGMPETQSPVAIDDGSAQSGPNAAWARAYMPGHGGLSPNEYQDKMQAKDDLSTKAVKDTYLSPEDYNALVGAAESVGPVREQKQHLQDLERLQAESLASLPNQKDESATLGLIDTYTGSKLAQNYRRPMTPEQRAQLLLGYGEKTKKDREALLKDVLQSARYMKSGTVMDQTAQQLVLADMLGRAQPRPNNSGAANDWKVISEGQKINKQYLDDKKILDTLDTNIARGDLQGFTTSLSLASRSLGGEKGVLTDKDTERVFPNVPGMTLAKLEAYVTNNPNVLLDRGMLKGFKALISTARENLKAKNMEALGTLKGAMGASPNFADKTKIVDQYSSQVANDKGPAQEPTLMDIIKARLAKEDAEKAKAKK